MSLLKPTRRELLLGLAAAPLAAISATSAYASFVEPHAYEVTQNEFFITDLPAAFEGFRILQISDVHHSKLVPISEVHRIVDLALSARPDMIVLTGDYTTAYRRFIDPCTEALGRLTAPEGVWAILGNHDHYTDPLLTVRALQRNHINVLNNALTVIRRGDDSLQLAGIDDYSWGATDWGRALRQLDRSRPSILLSHQPAVLDYDPVRDVSLILSGHTHGGQIRLPVIGAPAGYFDRDFRYLKGRYIREKTQLFVSRGTGVIGVGVRIGSPPEIAVIQLKRAV